MGKTGQKSHSSIGPGEIYFAHSLETKARASNAELRPLKKVKKKS